MRALRRAAGCSYRGSAARRDGRRVGGGGSELPIVSGTAVTGVGGSSAVLQGNVNPNDRPTTFLFEYGTTMAYGSTTAQGSLPKSKSNKPVSANVVGLQAETTYHFRLVATNSKGTTRGPDVSFTTLGRGHRRPPIQGRRSPTRSHAGARPGPGRRPPAHARAWLDGHRGPG